MFVCRRYLHWGERAPGGVWDGQDPAGSDAGRAERTEAGGRAEEGACHRHLQEESERYNAAFTGLNICMNLFVRLVKHVNRVGKELGNYSPMDDER